MNNELQKRLSSLEQLIETQKNCIPGAGNATGYMHGMANGMILAHAVFIDESPRYVSRPRRIWNKNIRHKCVKSKRNK